MPTDHFVESVLSALASADRQAAWCEFLERYSGLIYHVVHTFERDPDRSANCFLFICEQLSANGCRRLLKFDVAGRARFSTWLCAVVRNLCLDWHRKQHGRYRMFGSISRRSVPEQLIFQLVFRRGFSAEETWRELSRRGFDFSFAAVEDRIGDLRRCMTSRQLWLLSSGKGVADSIDAAEDENYVSEPVDAAPDPEALVALRETHEQVSLAVASLGDSDRLLVRLRYQEGLTLQQVATVVGLKDAQTADRRLRDIIDHLRKVLGLTNLVRGKANVESV